MNNMPKKVLIFEDNLNIQTLLKFFFKKHGVEIRAASDGTDAVALAAEYRPDLILMDCIMPGKDGIEAIGDLRQAGVATPIIMLTSKSFPADMERARRVGATAYLCKPFNPSELAMTIQPYLLT